MRVPWREFESCLSLSSQYQPIVPTRGSVCRQVSAENVPLDGEFRDAEALADNEEAELDCCLNKARGLICSEGQAVEDVAADDPDEDGDVVDMDQSPDWCGS